MTQGLRSKSVTTKITEPEYERIVQMAGASNRNISEWLRECLFREFGQSTSAVEHEVLLAEILALRTIILNLPFWTNAGEKLNQQDVLDLIRRADQNKTQKAHQRLHEAETVSTKGEHE
jgi:uncharacterized protein (DUF1697 family)